MIADILGAVLILIGVVFSVLGVIGILRLPDTYSQLHASGKTSTLGVVFICLGTAFLRPSAILELLALSIFVIFSGPVGSHAIAAAVHRGTGIRNEEAQQRGENPTLASGVHHNIEDYLKSITDETSTDTT
jgi:multicomponent Na+:H+ antiporter subunit G